MVRSTILSLLGVLALAPAALACPFCDAVALTFTEEMNANDVAVIATLLRLPRQEDDDDLSKAVFEVTDVLKGGEHLASGGSAGKPAKVEVLYFGRKPVGTPFLIMAANPPELSWAAPIALSERSVEYVKRLPELPAKGAERLKFFMNHLEDSEDLLQRDAYDEFAKAPYSEVKDLKPHMDRQQLLQWIKDPETSTSHRRLYLTMLGVCGQPEDALVLHDMLTEKTDEPRTGLDAVVACYLTLKGPSGMDLIEEEFLANQDADYTDTYAAIMALRFHGQEEDIIPRERLLQGLRHMLDRPQLADLVIPDLARWEDWSVIDRLAELFKNADEKSSWVRVPVVQYLRACPLPKAEEKLKELAKIDPDSIKRASFFLPLSGKKDDKPATPVPPPSKDTPAKETTGGEDEAPADPGADGQAAVPTRWNRASLLSGAFLAGGFAILILGLRR